MKNIDTIINYFIQQGFTGIELLNITLKALDLLENRATRYEPLKPLDIA